MPATGKARTFGHLPDFPPIPAEKIGLDLDESRRKLPTADEIDRSHRNPGKSGPGCEILDRN